MGLTFALEKVVVFDQGLYHGSGLVSRWMSLITTRFTAEARRAAPVRSGQLVAGIFGDGPHQVGVRQVQSYIESTSSHTMFVLAGTTGPIMSDAAFANPSGAYQMKTIYNTGTGKWTFTPQPGVRGSQIRVAQRGYFMPIPAHGDHAGFNALAVSGQAANNFLLTAWRRTGHDHTAIRGIGAPIGIQSF